MAESCVVKFGYFNVTTKDNSVTAQCLLFCKSKTVISEKIGTTSNFVRHLQREHREK